MPGMALSALLLKSREAPALVVEAVTALPEASLSVPRVVSAVPLGQMAPLPPSASPLFWAAAGFAKQMQRNTAVVAAKQAQATNRCVPDDRLLSGDEPAGRPAVNNSLRTGLPKLKIVFIRTYLSLRCTGKANARASRTDFHWK